jgi:hypothetical protein
MGVPGAIIAILAAITGIILSAVNSNWITLTLSVGLLFIALPFLRFIMMVHSANDRLDELEKKNGAK